MKKSILQLIPVFVTFFLIVLLSSCASITASKTTTKAEKHSDSKETILLYDPYDETISKVYPLDISYQNEMSEAKSKHEMELVKEKYISKWDAHVYNYYNILMEIDDTKVFADNEGQISEDTLNFIRTFDGWKTALQEDQKNWEDNLDNQIKRAQKLMDRIYTGGSTTGSAVSSYKLSLYRQRALHLYHLCTLFDAGCNGPK